MLQRQPLGSPGLLLPEPLGRLWLAVTDSLLLEAAVRLMVFAPHRSFALHAAEAVETVADLEEEN